MWETRNKQEDIIKIYFNEMQYEDVESVRLAQYGAAYWEHVRRDETVQNYYRSITRLDIFLIRVKFNFLFSDFLTPKVSILPCCEIVHCRISDAQWR